MIEIGAFQTIVKSNLNYESPNIGFAKDFGGTILRVRISHSPPLEDSIFPQTFINANNINQIVLKYNILFLKTIVISSN
ncbi:MAG: hypothetical protein J7J96_08060 [Sulfurimonas sp.]|nr:hypothetical protein [Sulfurimonas sp.]